jgi:hypothetical protein
VVKGFKPFMVLCSTIVAGTMVWQDVHRPATEVSIEVAPFRYTFDFSTSLRTLQRSPALTRSKSQTQNSDSRNVTLGFVETRLSYRIQVSRSLTNRRIVAVVAEYAPAVVHVAQEFKQDACSFDHVLDHEKQHVRIFAEESSQWHSGLQALVRSSLQADLPDEMLRVRIEKFILNADRRVYSRHSRLDSPAEYRENLTACNGRVRKLALGESLDVVMLPSTQSVRAQQQSATD